MHHIWENLDFDQYKKYKMKIYLPDICPLFMKLLLFTFINIDQMIFLEGHLLGNASANIKNIYLNNTD